MARDHWVENLRCPKLPEAWPRQSLAVVDVHQASRMSLQRPHRETFYAIAQKEKSRRHCALRLTGFENRLFMKTYPAPGSKS
jgi:hypothetical protein